MLTYELWEVAGVEGRYGDVPDGTELPAVVQVLVLQTEKVPHKTPGISINRIESDCFIEVNIKLNLMN